MNQYDQVTKGKRVVVMMEPELWAELKKLCHEESRSMSAVMRRLLQAELRDRLGYPNEVMQVPHFEAARMRICVVWSCGQ